MNTDQSHEWLTQIRLKVEQIVRRGGNVREEISDLVSGVAHTFYQTKDGLVDLAKAVAEGTSLAAKDALPGQAESVLRAVVHGLTDGMAKSAQAARLTLEEARAGGVYFAKEDLVDIAQDFRVLAEVIVNIVDDAADRIGGHVAKQVRTIGEHAKQTLLDMWPSLETAISAALHDPVKLGRESLQVGGLAARQSVGVLFSELGKRLQDAGHKLRH